MSALAVMVGVMAFPQVASAAAPSGWTEIIRDSFARTDSNDWGSAEVGGSYTLSYDSAAPTGQFSVTSGAASATVGPGSAAEADLLSISTADVQLQTSLVLPSVGTSSFGVYHAVQARVQADGSAYRGRIKVTDGGKASLTVSRVDGAGDTLLGNVALPFTVTSGKKVYLEFQVTGSSPVTMNLRSWLDGTAQPGWQYTVQDASSSRIGSAGSVGLWSYVSSRSTSTVVKTTGLDAWIPSAPTTTTTSTTTSTSTTTTAATTTATTTTTSAARGSAAVGSASYPIPSGAIFVSVNSGSDANTGTESSPLKTLAAALNKASTGKTIVLRAGTYNESVLVDTTVTIQAYPREAVWLDGSVRLSNWTKSGSVWVSTGWTKSFDRSTSYSRGDTSTRFLRDAYPLAAWPDQVFLDGALLKQVSSASAVVAGTFFVDYTADSIRIGSDPTGREVRSSNLTQAIYATAPDVTLQGFGVRRYATPIPEMGAVRMGMEGGTVRDLMITDNASTGLGVRGNDQTVDSVTVLRSGMLGIGANAAYGLVIKDSIVRDNNVEYFKVAPVSGGIKVTRSRTVTISNNDTSGNNGPGIWLDESCYNAKIVNNVSNDNENTGIEFEISDTAIIAGNQTVDNGIHGILVFSSGNVKIYNNVIGGNGTFGLQLSQDERRNANTSLPGHDPQRPNPDSTVPWIVKNIVVSNNVFGNGGMFQFYALDKRTNISADSMNITINGNLMNLRTVSGQPTMVAWGGSDNVTLTRYETPTSLASAKNSTWVNAAVSSMPVSSMTSAMSTYQSIAVPLPADIAAAVGQSTGAKKLGTF